MHAEIRPDRFVTGGVRAGRRRHPAVARQPRRPDAAVLRVRLAHGSRDRPARDAGAADHGAAPGCGGAHPSRATSRRRGRGRGSRCSSSSRRWSTWCAPSCRCRAGRRSGCGTGMPARRSRSCRPGCAAAVDLLIVDVFGGARIPAHVTSVEFYRECAAFLAPDGVLLVNVADGSGAAFARGQGATLSMAFDAASGEASPRVAVLAEPQVLRGRRFGNFVFVASASAAPPRLDAAADGRRTASGRGRPRPRTARLDRRSSCRPRLDSCAFAPTRPQRLPASSEATGSVEACPESVAWPPHPPLCWSPRCSRRAVAQPHTEPGTPAPTPTERARRRAAGRRPRRRGDRVRGAVVDPAHSARERRRDDAITLVSERDTGNVQQLMPDGTLQLIGTIPGVAHAGEGGLLGLAYLDDGDTAVALRLPDDGRRQPHHPHPVRRRARHRRRARGRARRASRRRATTTAGASRSAPTACSTRRSATRATPTRRKTRRRSTARSCA